MLKKTHAGEAGLATPVQVPLDPLAGSRRDDYWLKAVKSQHEAAKEIARTNAQASVRRAAIAAFMVAVVLICAIALGKPVPWPAAFVGKLLGS
jgi:hypothetical protein